MFPKRISDQWILYGSHTHRWMFFKTFQLFVSLRNNQKMGMIENSLSRGKLLKKGLKEIGIEEKKKNLKYIS